jgi:hypothetical protein
LKLGFSHVKGLWHYKYRFHEKKKNREKEKPQRKTENQIKKTEAEPEQKQSKNPEKEIIHREKERKGNQHTQRIVPAIAFISADIPAQKIKHPKQTHSRPASSS